MKLLLLDDCTIYKCTKIKCSLFGTDMGLPEYYFNFLNQLINETEDIIILTTYVKYFSYIKNKKIFYANLPSTHMFTDELWICEKPTINEKIKLKLKSHGETNVTLHMCKL